MNIILVGGGSTNATIGRFGNQFLNKARSEGNRVINISHRNHHTGHVDDRVIDYHNADKIKEVCEKISIDMPIIDIVLFNQTGDAFPHEETELFAEPDFQKYYRTMNIAVAAPHLIISSLYKNLVDGSKVLNMSSTMAFSYERDNYISAVGYPGAKGYATHLIMSMARCRTKKITFSSLCPYFLYQKPEWYENSFNVTYDHIFKHDDSCNGKILCQLDGNARPYVEGQVRYGR